MKNLLQARGLIHYHVTRTDLSFQQVIYHNKVVTSCYVNFNAFIYTKIYSWYSISHPRFVLFTNGFIRKENKYKLSFVFWIDSFFSFAWVLFERNVPSYNVYAIKWLHFMNDKNSVSYNNRFLPFKFIFSQVSAYMVIL